MRNVRWKILYEGTMIVLVIISLSAMMTNEDSNFSYVHQVIWIIFFIDVLIRFIKTSVKWRYIKDNPFDIVTIIPLEDSMLLARFARFLRLFRYKNIVKRYVDGVKGKLEEIGLFRLSLIIFSLNILLTLGLVLFRGLGLLESTIWVWGNFLKFNYETTIDGLILLSIIIKIIGLIYYGIVLSELMAIGRIKFEAYKLRRKQEEVRKKEIT